MLFLPGHLRNCYILFIFHCLGMRNKQDTTVMKSRDAMYRISAEGLNARLSLAQGNALWNGSERSFTKP
jgi:hypothetical protein